MGKKKGGKAEGSEGEEMKSNGGEGQNLLGSPTFEELGNGRYRCVETGHELPAHARDSYAQTKHCRLGLIDAALAHHKPPLNMFRRDPQSSSKLICKLTGDIINKNEEHIWKHINGKRFLNMLERKELEQQTPKDLDGRKSEKKAEKKSKVKPESLDEKKKKKEEENGEKSVSDVKDSSGKESEAEEEPDFWMPPVGERWDNDDGGDRWGSDSESGPEDGDVDDKDGESIVGKHDDEELSKRTKRMSLEIGPSSFASRKKKKKTSAA